MISRLVLAVFVSAMLAGSTAYAATFTLADLVSGASFTSDDGLLTFSNFEVTRLKKLSGDLTLYTVTTTSNGFELTSPEFDVSTGGKRKLDFTYTVTAASPIVQAGLDIEGTRTTGKILVWNDIDDDGDQGTFLFAFIRNGSESLSDSDQFSPGALSFDVEKSIRIKKISTLSSVTDSFQVVPEPQTLALFIAGSLGLMLFGRKRA